MMWRGSVAPISSPVQRNSFAASQFKVPVSYGITRAGGHNGFVPTGFAANAPGGPAQQHSDGFAPGAHAPPAASNPASPLQQESSLARQQAVSDQHYHSSADFMLPNDVPGLASPCSRQGNNDGAAASAQPDSDEGDNPLADALRAASPEWIAGNASSGGAGVHADMPRSASPAGGCMTRAGVR